LQQDHEAWKGVVCDGGRVVNEAAMAVPHGGTLVNLVVSAARAASLRAASREWRSWDLTPRQLCDLEMLSSGAFSPLRGFMNRRDYESVCAQMRLADGTLWPIPIVLDVSAEFARDLRAGDHVALRNPEGVMLAVVRVGEVWQPDRMAECEQVLDTSNLEHPGVAAVIERGPVLVGGEIEAIQLPAHFDFRPLRHTPAQLRQIFLGLGTSRVVAFEAREVMHRAHQELTLRAARDANAHLLIHPPVGMARPGDVDHYTRVRCYQALSYARGSATLSLLPLAVRMAGPRDALWHAIIHKNYGCTHVIVRPECAGPGSAGHGRPARDAQELVRRHEAELEIQAVPFRQMVYVDALNAHQLEDEVPPGTRVLNVSGAELRRLLASGAEIPAWFSSPEVVHELRRAHLPRQKQGLALFFTGLSGSGKSTLANAVMVRLLERAGRAVTLLDGDLVRKHLSSELGFSKEHRDLNIRRIGFVAAEIAKAGAVAICAPIAPYEEVRRAVRALVEANGGFVLVYVSTPLAVCERRDRKGLYSKARAGLIDHFTGISDPYEEPGTAEIVIDTTDLSVDAAVERILSYLERAGYLAEAPAHEGDIVRREDT
jgi:sulfate adenylyltransferase